MAAIEHQTLQESGLRATPARIGILRLLQDAQADEKHLSAEDIYRSLMRSERKPTMATIYRVLGEFEQRGLVARHHWPQRQGAAMFELVRRRRHDHLVCVESGRVIEFDHGGVKNCLLQLSREYGVELVNYDLVVYTRPRRDGVG